MALFLALAGATALATGLIGGHSLTIDPGSRTTSTALPEPPADAWLHARWALGPAAPAHTGSTLTWTGQEVLAIGGRFSADGAVSYTDGYAAYNPQAGTWRVLPSQASASYVRYEATRLAYTQRHYTGLVSYRPSYSLTFGINTDWTVTDFTLPLHRTDALSNQLTLDWYRGLQGCRILTDLSGWRAAGELDAHRGHPWLTMEPTLQSLLAR